MPDPEQVKKFICSSKECMANNKPHRHRLEACKGHPYCVDDAIQENVPIEMRLPQPFPIENSRMQKIFATNVRNGVFGETGPQKPGTKTVVTEDTLNHYLAQ